MKRMLMFSLLLLLFFSSSVMSVTAPKPYVGLFADMNHSECCVWRGMFMQFDAWLWWVPGPGGIQAVECAIEYPSNVILLAQMLNPDINMSIPACCSGGECCCVFNSCHMDWVYLFRQTFLLLDTVPSSINIAVYPSSGGVNVATCELGYPVVPATVFNNLGINQPCYIAVETSSWGAIKDLYR